MNPNSILNQLYKSKYPIKLWSVLEQKTKHLVIRQIAGTNNKKNVKLAQIILEQIREDDIFGRRDIHGDYVNLLCIVLAKTHNPVYIQNIVKIKRCGDLFYYTDSNLLFEFSPKGIRETCVKDTLEHIEKENEKEKEKNENKEEWYKVYSDWVKYYANMYDENIVIKYWNKYKTDTFKKRLDEIIEFM